MNTDSKISVVLATKNEEKNIERCLRSLKKQTYSPIEIIVVDAGSKDKTRILAKKYTDHVYDLSREQDLRKSLNIRGAQINFGVKKSNGKIIFFPDADMTFDKKLLEEAAQLIEKKNYDALYIPEVVMGKGFFGVIRNFERSFYNQTPIDAIRIIKKDLFEKIGGFDEKNIMFGPDDWDLTKRVRQATDKITITRNRKYHHEESLTIGSYLSKKSKYSHTFDGYIHKWSSSDSDIKKQMGFSYRFFEVFIEDGKWKRLISHPLHAVGMYFIRLLVGMSYLRHLFLNHGK